MPYTNELSVCSRIKLRIISLSSLLISIGSTGGVGVSSKVYSNVSPSFGIQSPLVSASIKRSFIAEEVKRESVPFGLTFLPIAIS